MRGSLAGSVVSNILLVLGAAMLVGPDNAAIQRRSLLVQLGLVAVAVVLLLIPSIPGFHGDPNRHSLALLSIGPAVALLALYVFVTIVGIRRRERDEEPGEPGWSMRAPSPTSRVCGIARSRGTGQATTSEQRAASSSIAGTTWT